MNSIRKRTVRIRTELKNRIAQRENYFKTRVKQEKEYENLMEMWKYYLNFTRLEF
jgi:hypothetical protein